MYRFTLLVVLVALLNVVIAQNSKRPIFECGEANITNITDDRGYLLINRNLKSCGFQAGPNVDFFVIKTNGLRLSDKEFIEFIPKDSADIETLKGPIDTDYYITDIKEPRINFHFDKLEDSSVVLEFIQASKNYTIPLDADKQTVQVVASKKKLKYDLVLTKTISQKVHVESSDHHLMEEASITIPVKDLDRVTVKTEPVLSDCSKKFEDKDSSTPHDITIDRNKTDQSYKCISLFNLALPEPAHYDVSFKNFIDMADSRDELTISDGSQTVRVNKFTAKDYDSSKPTISFKGRSLVVSYQSPQKVAPTGVPVKLTVTAETYGGVYDKYGALIIPDKGQARYSLRPPTNDSPNSLQIKGKFSVPSMKIFDESSRFIELTNKMYLPSEIGLQKGSDIRLELSVASKVGGSLEYVKQESGCSGTLFEASGTISISGASKTCYWLLGVKSTLDIRQNSLGQKGCIEIHLLSQEAPIFSRCNIDSSDKLPQFLIEPAYLKITTSAAATSSFLAVISPPVETLASASSGNQVSIQSVGYPSTYIMSAASDAYQVTSKVDQMILSVKDLDLRDGEKLLIGSSEIKSYNSDILVLNKTDIKVQRPNILKDSASRKGFLIIGYKFQKIITADIKSASIKTPKNLTSLLLKIPGAKSSRLSYNITFSSVDKNNQIRVLDSDSLSGRQVYEEENFHGSTTANVLLVSYISTKVNTTLPELTVTYSQIACNKTSDHICDNESRCIPVDKMCKGKSYCLDGSDLKVPCSSGPQPTPTVNQYGISGITAFFLIILALAIGAMTALYGPDLYKNLESRFRSGQYTTFSSTE